jgi:hypothetical protein
MTIGKISATVINNVKSQSNSNDFKTALLMAKKSSQNPSAVADNSLSFINAVNNHQKAIKTVEKFLVNTDYSPHKLLKIQYKTGVLFLREQMFCKTVELSANTIKNFTQMPL